VTFKTIIADPNPELFERTGSCEGIPGFYFVQQTFEQLDNTDILEGIACIANAGNSHGIMGAGVAGAIQKRYGTHVKWNARKAIQRGLLKQEIGESYVVGLGPATDSRYKYCAYTISMIDPGDRLRPDQNVPSRCMTATLRAVQHHNDTHHPLRQIGTLVVPGFGTGIGGLKPEDAGYEMVEAYKRFI
jgi:O-acetyl-ADP-ribose deacetylase (regulator of RNase III)